MDFLSSPGHLGYKSSKEMYFGGHDVKLKITRGTSHILSTWRLCSAMRISQLVCYEELAALPYMQLAAIL